MIAIMKMHLQKYIRDNLHNVFFQKKVSRGIECIWVIS